MSDIKWEPVNGEPFFLLYYFSFQGGRKVEFPTDPKVNMYIL